MILHVDCNSFYASCEQTFRPDLKGKPVVVLSNNDGLIVALSKEAKAAGIKRGDAYFEVKKNIAEMGGAVFSSNYTLYADMSDRIYRILKNLAPSVEPYSIDEAFLFFPPIRQITEIAFEIKETLERCTGIPVSIGIAPTKVLSKIANKIAKKADGVLNFAEAKGDAILSEYPVEDVWGIGYRYAAFLKKNGINTALDLKRYPLHLAKKHLSIKGYYIVQELNGTAMIDELQPKPKRNIISSRGFSHLVETLEPLEEATAEYCLEAVLKMRKQHSAASYIGVAVMTNRFREDLPQYYNWRAYELKPPSAYAPELVRLALRALHGIYKPGYIYQKVLVHLLNLVNEDRGQLHFFEEENPKKRAIMNCFDSVNARYGSHTLFIGAQGLKKDWSMKRNMLSPHYTTRLQDIPKVK